MAHAHGYSERNAIEIADIPDRMTRNVYIILEDMETWAKVIEGMTKVLLLPRNPAILTN